MKFKKVTFNQILLYILCLLFSISLVVGVIQQIFQSSSNVSSISNTSINIFFLVITFIIILNILYCARNNLILNNSQILIFIVFKIITLVFFLRFDVYAIIHNYLYALYYFENISILFVSVLYYFLYHTDLFKKILINFSKKIYYLQSTKKKFNGLSSKIPDYSIIVDIKKKINISKTLYINVCGPLELINEDDIVHSSYVIATENKKVVGVFKIKHGIKSLKVTRDNWSDIKKMFNLNDKKYTYNDFKNRFFLNIESKNILFSIKFSELNNKIAVANYKKYLYKNK